VLAAKLNWEPNFLAKTPEYHELSQPEGFLANCWRSKQQAKNQQLKRLIADVDICYRSFERSLFRCLLKTREPRDSLQSPHISHVLGDSPSVKSLSNEGSKATF
jgi:hypothetical protein